MKFLCDNCKAKYQIADEKVAGKTVRMKCRKCGHQIEVRAAVAEATPAPSPSALPPRAAPGGGPARPPTPARPLATSLSAAKPRAPSAPSALAGAFQRNVSDTPDAMPPSDAAAPIELSVTDEWYVAINGVPVGPVRLSELRRKAATGAVTEDSLCWQEGLEEWRPIRSIPELAALVREAAQGGQRLSTPDVPPSARAPAAATPRAPTPAPGIPAAVQPNFDATAAMPMPHGALPQRPAPAPSGRSNVVPLRPAATTDRASEDFGLGAAVAAASLAPQPMYAAAPSPLTSPLAPPVGAPVPDPFALPPPTSAPPAAAPLGRPYGEPSGAVAVAAPPPARGIPLWFWPVLLLALGFGGGLAFVVFKPQPTPAPVVIQVPATATAPGTTAAPGTAAPPSDRGDIPPPTAAGDTAPAGNDPSGKAAKGTGAGAKVATAAKPAATEEKKGLDLGGLVPGGGGPNVGPSGAGGGSSGGGLDQAGVERVVAQHRNGVKRTCWERGGGDQKSSVNVTINATIAPNGTVASTSSSGDDPVVAKCIENQVKTWTFSAPGQSQQIAIPFKFVRQ